MHGTPFWTHRVHVYMHMDIFNMTMTVKYLFMHPFFRLWMRVSVKIDTHKHFTLSRLIFTHMLQNIYCIMCMWNYYFMTIKLLSV